MAESPRSPIEKTPIGSDAHAPPLLRGSEDRENSSRSQASTSVDPRLSSKLKRTACILCRRRKLKCDAARPACATCSRLGHDCEYDEQRKKSGPKRGYVKALETRLAQVEELLRTEDNRQQYKGQHNAFGKDLGPISDLSTIGMADPANLSNLDHPEIMGSRQVGRASEARLDQDNENHDPALQAVMSTGLEEPLPEPATVDRLNELYFLKVNVSMPLIHKATYYAAMDLPPPQRPPICLRYAMWAQAASTSEDFEHLQECFYRRARKYLELDEMRGFGQSILSVGHCQAYLLTALLEFKCMFFPRAWMSTGRAIRLTQMLALHRLDGQGLDVKMAIAPPADWTELETRRRTFWMVFWADRCASIGTGWPMSFLEEDIRTNLPAPDAAFQNSQPAHTLTLAEALKSLDRDFSSTSACILMATLFGRNLTHLHRPEPDDNEQDLNGKFWQRHRSIDAVLLNIKLGLPDHLRIPSGIQDPNVVFLHMCLHSSAICLHQAAIFKAEKHRLPMNIAGESKMRCIAAASEIATIMRTVSHMDLTLLNPFIAFCLYVAARVFVQFLRARPSEQQVSASLQFLLTAMHAMTRKNPLTESFIAQLELDMASAGISNPLGHKSALDSVQKRGVPESQAPRKRPNKTCAGLASQHAPISYGSDEPTADRRFESGAARDIPFPSYSHTGGLLPYNSNARPSEAMDTSQDGPGSWLNTSTGQQYRAPPTMSPSTTEQGSTKTNILPTDLRPRMSSSNASYDYTNQRQPSVMGHGAPEQQTQPGEQQQMNVEEFNQFAPPSIDGLQLPAGWETMSFPGLTPGSDGIDPQEFAHMLAGVESWPGGQPLISEGWNNMPG